MPDMDEMSKDTREILKLAKDIIVKCLWFVPSIRQRVIQLKADHEALLNNTLKRAHNPEYIKDLKREIDKLDAVLKSDILADTLKEIDHIRDEHTKKRITDYQAQQVYNRLKLTDLGGGSFMRSLDSLNKLHSNSAYDIQDAWRVYDSIYLLRRLDREPEPEIPKTAYLKETDLNKTDRKGLRYYWPLLKDGTPVLNFDRNKLSQTPNAIAARERRKLETEYKPEVKTWIPAEYQRQKDEQREKAAKIREQREQETLRDFERAKEEERKLKENRAKRLSADRGKS